MSKTIWLRNVSDALYRRLKARAASADLTLSDYLIGELRKMGERPTPKQIRLRLLQIERSAKPRGSTPKIEQA
jgi:hypothetical protein